MSIQKTTKGVEVSTSSYRLLLDRIGGYAVRNVEIFGAGRLDRFDRSGEGPHPTCMYFDNITINNTFQLAYYGKENNSVTVEHDESSVRLTGQLIPIVENTPGRIHVQKEMRFEEDLYEVEVKLRFEETGRIDYASFWWDVNDKWLRAMRSSAGVFMPLAIGTGESFDQNLYRTWRGMKAMQRGAGVWMEMLGESCSILVTLIAPKPEVFESGGMKYWDGPNDADEGEGVSHGCINLDLINCDITKAPPLDIHELKVTYRVFLSGPTVFPTE